MTIGAPPHTRTDLVGIDPRVGRSTVVGRVLDQAPADLCQPQLVALAALALTGPAPLEAEHLAEATGRRRRSSAHVLEELVGRGLAQHAGYRLALPLPERAA